MSFIFNKIKFNNQILYPLFFAFLLFFTTQNVSAAELKFSPSSGSYNVGDTIKVRVVLSSTDRSSNAVAGVIKFPKDLLTVTSMSKAGSLISLWAIEPSYSNTNGSTDMEGVILNGFKGSNGTIVTINFKAKAVGNANIKFASSSVLANDGEGTNILSDSGQANFQINKGIAPIEKVTPIPTKEVIEQEPPLFVPVITEHSGIVLGEEYMVVKGISNPNIDIVINSSIILSNGTKVKGEEKVLISDDNGMFTYVSEKALVGNYEITARARSISGIESEKSVPVKIKVLSRLNYALIIFMSNTYIVVSVILLLVLLILIAMSGWMKFFHYRQRIRKKLSQSESIVNKSFNILDDDMEEEMKILNKIKALHSLTPEERSFINQFKRDIEESEKVILDEIKETDNK